MPRPIGDKLGRYDILAPLGSKALAQLNRVWFVGYADGTCNLTLNPAQSPSVYRCPRLGINLTGNAHPTN